jgi:hypothetical protein
MELVGAYTIYGFQIQKEDLGGRCLEDLCKEICFYIKDKEIFLLPVIIISGAPTEVYECQRNIHKYSKLAKQSWCCESQSYFLGYKICHSCSNIDLRTFYEGIGYIDDSERQKTLTEQLKQINRHFHIVDEDNLSIYLVTIPEYR